MREGRRKLWTASMCLRRTGLTAGLRVDVAPSEGIVGRGVGTPAGRTRDERESIYSVNHTTPLGPGHDRTDGTRYRLCPNHKQWRATRSPLVAGFPRDAPASRRILEARATGRDDRAERLRRAYTSSGVPLACQSVRFPPSPFHPPRPFLPPMPFVPPSPTTSISVRVIQKEIPIWADAGSPPSGRRSGLASASR